MKHVKNNATLKANARLNLEGKYLKSIEIILIYFFSSLLMTNNIPLKYDPTLKDILLYCLLLYFAEVVLFTLKTGTYHFFINLHTKKPYGIADILYAFTRKNSAAFVVGAIKNAILFIALLPMVIYFYYNISKPFDFTIWCTGGIIGITGFAIYYCIWINYSQVILLLSDFPDKSPIQLMKLSAWLMKGHKKRFLYLQLSFVPYIIAGFISMGLGLIWLFPYMSATYTAFYVNLSSLKASIIE